MKVVDILKWKEKKEKNTPMYLENKLAFVDEWLMGSIEEEINRENPDTAIIHRRMVWAKETYQQILTDSESDQAKYQASRGINKVNEYYKDFFGKDLNTDY